MTHKLLPIKPSIKFSDFEKIDIRVGTIEKVEKNVPDGTSAG